MKPKIAIIIERADIGLGGAERSVSEMAEALCESGLEVHILAAKGKTQAKNTHILCGDLPGKRVGYRVFEQAIKRHLLKNHYDIIHSVLPFDFADIYQPRGGTYAEAARRNAASYSGCLARLLKSVMGFANFRRSALLKAEKKLCGMPNGPAVIAISDYVAEQFSRHYGVDKSRISLIYSGVRAPDAGNEEQTSRLRKQILAQAGVEQSDNPVIFLFAANNFRLKGLNCLLRALRSALTKDCARPILLVVVGTGRPGRYKRLAAKLRISGNILFLGKVGRIAEVLSAADVAVLPTFYDPCSRFILEALAIGKPVITTRFNGAAELFTNSRHGIVVDRPDDMAGLADALAYFTRPGKIQDASKAILEDNIRQQVSIARVAEQLKAFYEAILEKRRR